MGNEKMCRCEEGTANANRRYPSDQHVASANVRKAIDEMWKIYEREGSGDGRVSCLCTIVNMADTLRRIGSDPHTFVSL